MAVLWSSDVCSSDLPPLPTSPLGIPPTTGGIPTFPQYRRRRRMEKWETKTRFPTFPPPRFPPLNQTTSTTGAASPLRPPQRMTPHRQHNERRPSVATFPIQAHRLLESTCHFRLISHWNQFLISGSLLDWKMLWASPCAGSAAPRHLPDQGTTLCRGPAVPGAGKRGRVRDLKVGRFTEVRANRENPGVHRTSGRAATVRERWLTAWPANAPLRSRLRLGFHVHPLLCRAPGGESWKLLGRGGFHANAQPGRMLESIGLVRPH